MKDVKSIIYREARIEDVPAMADLFFMVLKNLFERNNICASLPPQSEIILGYEHVLKTGIFHLAEENDNIVGIAGAVVRDAFWYLSSFWVYPEYQNRKIGMPLLKQVWKAGIDKGSKVFFTWSSIDVTAIAAYMKIGMLPHYQILQFEGMIKKPTKKPANVDFHPLEPATSAKLDRSVIGFERKIDHDFFSMKLNCKGIQVARKGKVIGYFYVREGNIGPIVWEDESDADVLMQSAFYEAEKSGKEIHIAVPTINNSAVRFVVDSGLRLKKYAHFAASQSFGQLKNYIPSGALLY